MCAVMAGALLESGRCDRRRVPGHLPGTPTRIGVAVTPRQGYHRERNSGMATLSTSTAARRQTRHTLPPLMLAAVVLVWLAPAAKASVGVGTNAARPSLRVDAHGNAQVSYTTGDGRKTVLVPLRGPVLLGGTLDGKHVSKPAKKPDLPYLKVLHR